MTFLKGLKKEVFSSISESIKLSLNKEDTLPFNLTTLNPLKRKTQANKHTNNMVIQLLSITTLSIACTYFCFGKINTKLVIKKCIFVYLPHEILFMSDALVIIPTYNEKENIEAIIRATFNQKKEFHILVVDDNSPDGTSAIVENLILEFPNQLFLERRIGKSGLGTAYIHGFKWAIAKKYDYIIEMDADFSHNPDDLIRLYDACHKENISVSVGSRYVNNKINVVNWDIKRLLLSYFASKYVRLITRIPLFDTTAGFVCWKREVLENIQLEKIKFVGYAFQIEMKFKAWKRGFKIKEVSVIFTDRTLGTSKMSGNIIYEALFGVIKMRLQGISK